MAATCCFRPTLSTRRDFATNRSIEHRIYASVEPARKGDAPRLGEAQSLLRGYVGPIRREARGRVYVALFP